MPPQTFLGLVDDPDSDFIKPSEIVLLRLCETLLYIKQASGGHLLVAIGGELVCKFLYHLLIAGDGSTG